MRIQDMAYRRGAELRHDVPNERFAGSLVAPIDDHHLITGNQVAIAVPPIWRGADFEPPAPPTALFLRATDAIAPITDKADNYNTNAEGQSRPLWRRSKSIMNH
jgi:hypothetical protein